MFLKEVKKMKNNKIDIKLVQHKILEVAIAFDNFCKKHNLTYFLMGGSALGCARHKGFIPWDDDLDVFMKYEDFCKFKEIISIEPIDGYYFQKGNTHEMPLFISKLRMNGTIFMEKETINREMHQGVYIDIMILNKAPNTLIQRIKQFYYAKILVANSLVEFGYTTDNKFKQIIMKYAYKKIKKNGKKKYINEVLKYNSLSKFKYYTHLFGRANYKSSFYKKEWFDSSIEMPFENAYFNMPVNFNSYLIKRYGKKYMEMPSQKTKDKYPVHAVYVDLGQK